MPQQRLRAAGRRVLRRDPDAPLSATLPGTWALLSRVDVTDAGEQRTEPSLGTDPIAWLIYDRAGHFAAQFMKRERLGAQTATTHAAASNNSRAQNGYDAYFGIYEIDDATRVVTQRLLAALSAENVGLTLRREMRVVGDQMTVIVRTTAADGEPLTRTLTWQRIGQ